MIQSNLISIILPVYNGEKYLPESIESLLNQSYVNFELIIVDDCSSDNSLEIASKYARDDTRIKIITNEENIKLPATLNVGHKHARGNFITWTSDDNIAKPIFLEKLLEKILNEDTDIVFSNYDMINSVGSFRREQIAGPVVNLIYGNVFGVSFLYKKEVFFKLKGYNESLFLVEDYDFWLRASLKFSISHLDANLFQYRIHENSLTSNIQTNTNINSIYIYGIKHIFSEVSRVLGWNHFTEVMIKSFHLGTKIDLDSYLNNRNNILEDIEKYQKRVNTTYDIKSRLWYLLRDQWKSQPKYHCLSFLFKVIKTQPQILFYEEFSKKQTLILFFKCFKSI